MARHMARQESNGAGRGPPWAAVGTQCVNANYAQAAGGRPVSHAPHYAGPKREPQTGDQRPREQSCGEARGAGPGGRGGARTPRSANLMLAPLKVHFLRGNSSSYLYAYAKGSKAKLSTAEVQVTKADISSR